MVIKTHWQIIKGTTLIQLPWVKLTFTLIQVKQLSPEYFHVTGKYYLTRTIGDASGHFTLMFRKINGKWVIISDHSS